MLKITGAGTSGAPRRSEKARGGAGSIEKGAFRQTLSGAIEAAGDAPTLAGTQALGAVDTLILTQSVDGTAEREARRRLIQYGEDILDQLDDLRRDLLVGTVSKDRLMALAQQVRARRESCHDPRLAALLDDIELRAEVEIAKLTTPQRQTRRNVP